MGWISQLKNKARCRIFFCFNFRYFVQTIHFFPSTNSTWQNFNLILSCVLQSSSGKFSVANQSIFRCVGIIYYTWTSLRHKDHVNVLWDKIISQTFAIRPKMCVCEQENHVCACHTAQHTHTTKCEKEDPFSTDKMCRVYLIFWPTHYTSCKCSNRIFLFKYYLKPVSFRVKPYHLPFVNVFKPSKIWDELFNLFRCVSSSAQEKKLLLHNHGCWFWRVLRAVRHSVTWRREMETEARKRERESERKYTNTHTVWHEQTKRYPPKSSAFHIDSQMNTMCEKISLCIGYSLCIPSAWWKAINCVCRAEHKAPNIQHRTQRGFSVYDSTQHSLDMPA